MQTLKIASQQLQDELSEIYNLQEAQSIADWLMEHITGLSRSERICYPDKMFSPEQEQQWQKDAKELLEHRPLQYVLGTCNFYGLWLKVNEAVLIPRPETEELVALCLKEIDGNHGSAKGINILDIGTGSGCIALALKNKLPEASVFAADYSLEALALAEENALQNHLEVNFLHWDVLSSQIPERLPSKFTIIISNPPYITLAEKDTIQPNVLNFEPHSALFVSNADPLQFYKRIEILGQSFLETNGILFLELHEKFAVDTQNYFQGKGWLTELKLDFQGKPRMLVARKK